MCRKVQARSSSGVAVLASSKRAIEWDISGAIYRAVFDGAITPQQGKELFIAFHERWGLISIFSDHNTKEECVARLIRLEREILDAI